MCCLPTEQLWKIYSQCILPHAYSPTYTYMGNNFTSGFGLQVPINSAPLTTLLIYFNMSSDNYVQAASTTARAGCPKCLANGLQIKSHQKEHYSPPFYSSTSGKKDLVAARSKLRHRKGTRTETWEYSGIIDPSAQPLS